ncbi:hypothetical protein INR49_004821, partial [Caranx melampygus]
NSSCWTSWKKTPALPGEEEKERSIEIEKLTCYWDGEYLNSQNRRVENLDAPSLQSISVTVKPHQLLAVIGPVGAGKSSLLSAILGELPHDTGLVEIKPWVFPGTIRSNILFGKAEPRKYERVIRACALKKDLELLPDGDLTLIGDRGATLSGGQKARVNLPGRTAVYQDADIYLLDDPLSAVDAEVGKHLFEQCICGLLKNKCRVLVTHQLQHLRAADHIVVLKEVRSHHGSGHLQRAVLLGLDVVSLLRSDEEQERLARSTDPDKVSSHSQRTQGSHCSYSSLLPPESNGTDQLPVGTSSE